MSALELLPGKKGASANDTITDWFDQLDAHSFSKAYLRNDYGEFIPVNIQQLTQELGIDPFSIQHDTSPFDPRVRQLRDIGFYCAFIAKPGFATAIRSKGLPIVEAAEEEGALGFNLFCSSFSMVMLSRDFTGFCQWIHYSRQAGAKPWTFEFNVTHSGYTPARLKPAPAISAGEWWFNNNNLSTLQQLISGFNEATLVSSTYTEITRFKPELYRQIHHFAMLFIKHLSQRATLMTSSDYLNRQNNNRADHIERDAIISIKNGKLKVLLKEVQENPQQNVFACSLQPFAKYIQGHLQYDKGSLALQPQLKVLEAPEPARAKIIPQVDNQDKLISADFKSAFTSSIDYPALPNDRLFFTLMYFPNLKIWFDQNDIILHNTLRFHLSINDSTKLLEASVKHFDITTYTRLTIREKSGQRYTLKQTDFSIAHTKEVTVNSFIKAVTKGTIEKEIHRLCDEIVTSIKELGKAQTEFLKKSISKKQQHLSDTSDILQTGNKRLSRYHQLVSHLNTHHQ